VNGNVDIVAALLVGIPGIALAVVGAWVATRISDTASHVSFAILILVIATRTIAGAVRNEQ
jgi:uncharacterized membrane protein YfcA